MPWNVTVFLETSRKNAHATKERVPATLYRSRYGIEFLQKDLLHFGCEVSYKPANPRLIHRPHSFGSKLRSGIFMGYSINIGGLWNGDLLVADWEAIEVQGHSEISCRLE